MILSIFKQLNRQIYKINIVLYNKKIIRGICMSNDIEIIRLNKLMATRGMCSRREADDYILKGLVYVDNQQIHSLGTKVKINCDIRLDSKVIDHQRKKQTIILNKPLGFVSCQPEKNYNPAIKLLTEENYFIPNVTLKARKEDKIKRHNKNNIIKKPIDTMKMAVCGRLDVNSTGLLLFTQNGIIARKLLSPFNHIEKEYLVRFNTILYNFPSIDKILIELQNGVQLDTYKLKSMKITIINENQMKIILTEGKKRQIRRMCAKYGLHVNALKRVRIGKIKLGPLPLGKWRYLDKWEQKYLSAS